MKTSAILTHYERVSGKVKSAKIDYTIFIVEDSNSTRIWLQHFLERMPNCTDENRPNCKVLSFETGEECLNNLDLKPDIVILDYFLDSDKPDADNGLLVLRRIKKALPKAQVIIMSSQQNVMVTSELFASGAFDYISKEHYANARVEQSVLKAIEFIKHNKKIAQENNRLNLILFLFGILIGSFLMYKFF